MQNQHLENIWFKAVIENPSYIETTEPGYFKNSDYQEAFKVVKSFWRKYNQIPSKNQVRESAKLLKIQDKLSDSLLESMWSISLSDYDSDWLSQNTQAWIEWKTLEKSALDSINYIKSTEVTPDNIKDVINTYKSIIVDGVMENNATEGRLNLSGGLWSSANAITTLQFATFNNSNSASANFVEGSTFQLYGISNITSTAKATGGIVSSDGSYNYHMFPFSGTFTPTEAITADVLVIAGGGGASR